MWELAEEDGATVVAASSHSRRLAEIFRGEGVDVVLADGLDDVPAAGSVTLMQSAAGGLSDGFSLPINGRGRSGGRDGRLVVYSDVEIFGVAKQRRTRRRSVRGARDAFLSELSPGDYVVHVEHGIGRFAGTVRGVKADAGSRAVSRDNGEDDREYLAIEYANDDKLYVPLEHLDRVAPYIAPMDRPPSLTRLGNAGVATGESAG